MEILNEFMYAEMHVVECIFSSLLIGILFGIVMMFITIEPKAFFIGWIIGACLIFGIFYKCGYLEREVRYEGYITNWDEFCEEYEVLKIRGRLVTARKKDDK